MSSFRRHDTAHSRLPRGVACAGHVLAAHVRADPGVVWTALTDPGQTAGYLRWLPILAWLQLLLSPA